MGGGLGGGGGGKAFDCVQMKRDFDFGRSVGGPSLLRTAKEKEVHCSGSVEWKSFFDQVLDAAGRKMHFGQNIGRMF